MDALPRILSATSGGDGSHEERYVTWIHDVQRHYGLTVVDIARMAGYYAIKAVLKRIYCGLKQKVQ